MLRLQCANEQVDQLQQYCNSKVDNIFFQIAEFETETRSCPLKRRDLMDCKRQEECVALGLVS